LSETPVVVIGAGIIGLAVAYHLAKAGARVTVVDRDPEGDTVSLGNAGGIAVTEVVPASVPGTLWRVPGWMIDPLGPVAVRASHALKMLPWLMRFAQVGTPKRVDSISRALAALNSRVYDDLLPMLNDIGLSAELHRKGALTVYESEIGYQRDATEWAIKRARGIVTEEVTGDEARQMEPALGSLVRHAVFTPQWSYVSDPGRIVRKLRDWLLMHQVAFRRGEVRDIAPHTKALWLRLEEGAPVRVDKVVVAAGAWSGILARRLGDPVLLESERGYNSTIRDPGVAVERQLIFGERKFVATPLECGLRIGGAAEFGGLYAKPNFKRSDALLELARRYLPNLRTDSATQWAGHRPTTPDTLPVIGGSGFHPNVFYAFGHGHLGLTQAATTGRLMSELVLTGEPAIDLTPYTIQRFKRPQ
jgi:D-amino-acid dehydrogenase